MGFFTRALFKMAIFTGCVLAAGVVLHQPLIYAFSHNIALNTTIFSIFTVGMTLCFWNVMRLYKEQKWLHSYERGQERFPGTPKARILAPFALVMTDGRGHQSLSPILARSLLSSIEARLENMRDGTRYIVGLLIFMGLLGTFWGLSHTIGAIAGVISGIDLGAGDVKDAFLTLKQGLQSPLKGMGTAFSCSMFGLAGSLIVGFLDMQVGHLSTAFYNEVEERLTLLTRVSSVDAVDASHSGPAYLQGMLEQVAENMHALQGLLRTGEESRTSVIKVVQGVGERLSIMSEHMITHQQLLKKIAEHQLELQNALRQFQAAQHNQDDPLRHHLRSMDATLAKLLEESINGRNRSTHDLQNEIRLVARTISALADGQEVAA